MEIKIISDGTSLGTSIIDEETGKRIPNCTDLVIKISSKTKLAECYLTLIIVPFEYTGEDKTENVWQEAWDKMAKNLGKWIFLLVK